MTIKLNELFFTFVLISIFIEIHYLRKQVDDLAKKLEQLESKLQNVEDQKKRIESLEFRHRRL